MDINLRPAMPDDIPDLARLIVMATCGVIDAVYHDLVPGWPTSRIIERRFSRLGTTASYRNFRVAARRERVIGMVHAYPIDDEANDPPDPLIPKERYAIYEPFRHLEAPGSYYINGIAVYPEFRAAGIGTRLLSLARSGALDRGLSEISLNVFERNADAVRLYRRLGFKTEKRYPVIAHELIRHSGNLLLMTCPAQEPNVPERPQGR